MKRRKNSHTPASQILSQRLSGVLLHPTSLPGGHGIGDLGISSRAFVQFLAAAKQRIWQMLPTGPTSDQDYHSPYNSTSAFAGNPLLISLDELVKDGLLSKRDLATMLPVSAREEGRVNFAATERRKYPLLAKAAENFTGAKAERALDTFLTQEPWVRGFAQYVALRKYFNKGRDDWSSDFFFAPQHLPAAARSRCKKLLAQLEAAVRTEIVTQFIYFQQWAKLREFARNNGVYLLGDLPIYVSSDSADVWEHPEIFEVDRKTGKASLVSGVPPDPLNLDGQLWGHPLYRWKAIEKSNFTWWVDRFRTLASMFDVVRVDHFRGFESYWAVPARDNHARNGSWKMGPGAALFHAVKKGLGELPVFIEDIGTITPPVHALRESLGFMGTRILQFAFGGDPSGSSKSRHHPMNIPAHSVVYSATHDNAPVAQWFKELPAPNKAKVLGLLNDCAPAEVPHQFTRLAMATAAKFCVMFMQDILGGGEKTRMNSPGTHSSANWSWRMSDIPMDETKWLARLSDIYERNM